MNVQLDLVLPPIVVGVLIVLTLGINRMMMESQTTARLSHEMQTYANSTIQLLQEEFRDVFDVVNLTDTTFTYSSVNLDTVRIERMNRDLLLIRFNQLTGLRDTTFVPSRLNRIGFELLGAAGAPPMMRVRVESASIRAEESGDARTRSRGFAERDIYLRNLDLEP